MGFSADPAHLFFTALRQIISLKNRYQDQVGLEQWYGFLGNLSIVPRIGTNSTEIRDFDLVRAAEQMVFELFHPGVLKVHTPPERERITYGDDAVRIVSLNCKLPVAEAQTVRGGLSFKF